MNEKNDSAPFFAVRTLPTLSPPGALPFLFVADEVGDVALSREALSWANALTQTRSLSSIEQWVGTIGRLHDWYVIGWQARPLTTELLTDLVYSYLYFRLHGTIDPSGRTIVPSISWKPVRYETVQGEYSAIRSYVQHCNTAFGHIGLARRTTVINQSFIAQMLADKESSARDFFAHLNAHRERWRTYFDFADDMPRLAGGKRPIRSRVGFRQMMPIEEWVALIDAEKNLVFRGIWMLSAFGGLRISEILNMWQVDVLPASYRGRLFGFDDDTILVLRAHPCDSTYTTTVGDRRTTRRQHLATKYGRVPRPDSIVSSERAGWKGTVFANDDRLLLPVFWLDARMAELFADCVQQIMRFHQTQRTSASHPYLFVNMAARRDALGEPQKISNVEAAFERACRRVGLEPYRYGRSIHAGRHLYKWMAKEMLGLGPDAIQLIMGHASIESQDAYGRRAKEAADSIRMGQSKLETGRG
ncbi:hypothetical protein [Magnetospirillum sulfuroxidans]|uniref:Tyr recombinase domain-containing protein n=1 Tax=Magnetospirillum sulfuroxidans TaxID=611300 RepID=A0ABS5ICE8_9PROT|nr:hypothetical protein [Magnetospirillum sulfuroxidans]MBR9972103.1 hypothetical protein [Magnetospirillum sulfuroxidans]